MDEWADRETTHYGNHCGEWNALENGQQGSTG